LAPRTAHSERSTGSISGVAGRGVVLLDLTSLAEIAGTVGALAAASWALYQRCYVAVPPNQALVLFGRRSGRAARREDPRTSSVVARAPRVLVGGGTVLAPWDKAYAYLSLAPIDVEATVRAVHSIAGGSAAGWEVQLAVQAKVASEPDALRLAAEELFGMSASELVAFVRRAVEGSVPPVLARLGVVDAEPDWDRLGAEIQATVAPELVRSGLVVRSVLVRELRRLAGASGASLAGDERSRGGGQLASAARSTDEVDVRLRRIEHGLRSIGGRLEALDREAPGLETLSLYESGLGRGSPSGDVPFDDSMQEGPSGRARPPSPAARARAGEPPTASDEEFGGRKG